LDVSTGMINGLSKELSRKSEAKRKEIFHELVSSPVLHTDLTGVRVNGQKKYVIVCATKTGVLYFARDQKGHNAVKGTPIEFFLYILIHDHDLTFYNYGTLHQECLEHILRYLVGSIENEKNLTWNKQMHELIREMIHFCNRLDPEDNRDPDVICPDIVEKFEERYDEILDLAKKEYEYEPPTQYYVDGFNLQKRLRNFKSSHLLFLHNREVPHNNNLSERLLRIIVRKAKQVMAFRSFDGLAYLCDCLSVIASIKANGGNLFESVAAIFNSTVDNSKSPSSSSDAIVLNNSQPAC